MSFHQSQHRHFEAMMLVAVGALVTMCATTAHAQSRVLDLAGKWNFSLDRQNVGVNERWFERPLGDKITLPGILEAQGYGDEISTTTPWVLSLYDHYWFEREDYKKYTKPGNVKVPFLAQPPRHYTGAAWYEREIDIPAEWAGKRIQLFLERPHWETTVWLDGTRIGSQRSLVAPHEHEFGQVTPGRHRLAVRVNNSLILPYRPDAHSVSDSLGMAWNGIVGKIELRATSPVWIDDAQVFPSPEDPSSREGRLVSTMKISIRNITGKSGSGVLSTTSNTQVPVKWDESGGVATLELAGRAGSWDEFHPELQKIAVKLGGEDADDAREVTFGFRDLETEGKDFLLNGRAVYFRGTHDGGDFPLTGYPPTDVAFWRKRFQVVKDWGLNHVRFHSFCPPDAAFQAADELGIYLQPEPGMWNEVSPGTPMEKMLYEETDAMIRAYGNHPSFLMLAPSNEPKGRWKQAFDKWIAHYREADPRRLYNNGTGHTEPSVPDLAVGTDFLTMQRIGQRPLRGSAAWFNRDYRDSLDDINVPVLSHETGQWVAYPDNDIIRKFTGFMRPGNYEIFRDSLAARGMLSKNKEFAYASGRFQLECYKEEIEANLRTPGLSGYQLLDLHDYLGQGTALVGVLDAFWESKGYVTAKEFRRFNSETVPLARPDKRVYTDAETFTADVEIAHFGERPIVNAAPVWSILNGRGQRIASGEFPRRDIPIGKNIALGNVSLALAPLASPEAYRLVVELKGTTIANDWNFWVYPSKSKADADTPGILITHSWDEAEARLKQGGKVLFMPRKADLDWTSPSLDWVPVFWNRLMNPAWGRMLGLLIDKNHPALARFPTESYYDWQWSSLVTRSRAMNLDRLPKGLQPIVQPIDDWNRNYKLGLIFEARVGRGKLMVSMPDLENSLDRRVAARQLRRSLLDYMSSAQFAPKTTILPENFRQVFFDTYVMKKLHAAVDGPGGSNAIDGDPNTFWLAGDQKDTTRKNQELRVRFPKPVPFSGVIIMPRQNHREHEGDIRDFEIEISDDGGTWTQVHRGSLVSSFEPQRIEFGRTVTARYLKFTALSGFGTDKTAAIAELAVVYTGPKLADGGIDYEYQTSISASPDIDEVGKPKPTITPR